jgi:hypothetical protein
MNFWLLCGPDLLDYGPSAPKPPDQRSLASGRGGKDFFLIFWPFFRGPYRYKTSQPAETPCIESGAATPWQVQLENSSVTIEFAKNAKIIESEAFKRLFRAKNFDANKVLNEL